MSISQNGQPEIWNLDLNIDDWTKQYLLPYLNVNKYCGTSSSNNCKFSGCYNNETAKRCTGDKGSSYSRFYLADGSQVALNIVKNGSTDGIDFYIDIDGHNNGENKFGKDIFIYHLYTAVYNPGVKKVAKKYPMLIKPKGIGGTIESLTNPSSWGSCVKGKRGEVCSTLLLLNNWKVPKDYPL